MAEAQMTLREAASFWWLILMRGIAALVLGLFLISSPAMRIGVDSGTWGIKRLELVQQPDCAAA